MSLGTPVNFLTRVTSVGETFITRVSLDSFLHIEDPPLIYKKPSQCRGKSLL